MAKDKVGRKVRKKTPAKTLKQKRLTKKSRQAGGTATGALSDGEFAAMKQRIIEDPH